MTLYATLPTQRVKMSWQDHITTVESYKAILATGRGWDLFDSFPTEEEFKEYLKSKEGSNVTN